MKQEQKLFELIDNLSIGESVFVFLCIGTMIFLSLITLKYIIETRRLVNQFKKDNNEKIL